MFIHDKFVARTEKVEMYRLKTLAITAVVISGLVLLSGCTTEKVQRYQDFLEEIDYKSIGDIQNESSSSPLFGVPGNQDYVRVDYIDADGVYDTKPSPDTSIYNRLIERVNLAGGACSVSNTDLYAICVGVEGLKIEISVRGEKAGLKYKGGSISVTQD